MSRVEERLRVLLEDAAPQTMALPVEAIERGARRRRRRTVTLTVFGAAAAVLVSAAGVFGLLTPSSAPVKTPPVGSPSSSTSAAPAGEYTHTAAWLAVGQQIRDARRANHGLTAVIPVQLSAPVDVTGPGAYVMEVGPVPATTKPGDVAMTLPPDMTSHFVVVGSPLHGLTFVHRAAGTFVQVHIHIGGFRSPYHHLTAWFQ
jgi:hypothetical protein